MLLTIWWTTSAITPAMMACFRALAEMGVAIVRSEEEELVCATVCVEHVGEPDAPRHVTVQDLEDCIFCQGYTD